MSSLRLGLSTPRNCVKDNLENEARLFSYQHISAYTTLINGSFVNDEANEFGVKSKTSVLILCVCLCVFMSRSPERDRGRQRSFH